MDFVNTMGALAVWFLIAALPIVILFLVAYFRKRSVSELEGYDDPAEYERKRLERGRPSAAIRRRIRLRRNRSA